MQQAKIAATLHQNPSIFTALQNNCCAIFKFREPNIARSERSHS